MYIYIHTVYVYLQPVFCPDWICSWNKIHLAPNSHVLLFPAFSPKFCTQLFHALRKLIQLVDCETGYSWIFVQKCSEEKTRIRWSTSLQPIECAHIQGLYLICTACPSPCKYFSWRVFIPMFGMNFPWAWTPPTLNLMARTFHSTSKMIHRHASLHLPGSSHVEAAEHHFFHTFCIVLLPKNSRKIHVFPNFTTRLWISEVVQLHSIHISPAVRNLCLAPETKGRLKQTLQQGKPNDDPLPAEDLRNASESDCRCRNKSWPAACLISHHFKGISWRS